MVSKIKNGNGRLIEVQEKGETIWNKKQEEKRIKRESKKELTDELKNQGVIGSDKAKAMRNKFDKNEK